MVYFIVTPDFTVLFVLKNILQYIFIIQTLVITRFTML